MAQFVNIYPVDLQKGPVEVSLNRMYLEDIKANRVGVTVTDGGAAVALGGTCSGTAILSNGSTVAISGTTSGNQAYIELPSAVYTVDGPVEVFVNLTNGGIMATLLHGHGTVVQTDTGTVIDPGTIIPSVSALIADIDAAVASIPADYTALLAAVAPAFSASNNYTAGRYVWNSGNLYRFTADHAAGSWTGTDAVQVVVTNEIADLKSAIAGSNLPINYAVISTETETDNGLTFSAVNGTVTVDGTSTGVAFYDLFRLLTNPEGFPLKAGHTYALRFADETLSPLIYKQVEYKVSSSSQIISLYSKNLLSDYVVFTVPETFYDFYVRLVCDSSGVTYANKTISFSIEEITDKKDVIIVDVNGNGDFTSLKAGIEYAMLKYGTRVIVKQGTYNLVNEFGKSYLDNLSGNDFGIMLGNGIELIFAPNAYVSFDYDGTNPWIINNFSPFNTANDLGFTIDGMHCTAHNCRYILHDDPRPGVKDRYSKNVIRNCYFELFPSANYPSWVNHQIIGGGLGDSTMVEIENCIFNDHFSGVNSYASVSYHNSTSGYSEYESRIIVKDCYFADGNNLVFEGYGASPHKTKVIATNNNLTNGDDSIIYSNTQADNMTLYKWNNHARI